MGTTSNGRHHIEDCSSYQEGVCYLYGRTRESLRLFLHGHCSIELLRDEYQLMTELHDALYERWVTPVVREGDHGPVVKLPRL